MTNTFENFISVKYYSTLYFTKSAKWKILLFFTFLLYIVFIALFITNFFLYSIKKNTPILFGINTNSEVKNFNVTIGVKYFSFSKSNKYYLAFNFMNFVDIFLLRKNSQLNLNDKTYIIT